MKKTALVAIFFVASLTFLTGCGGAATPDTNSTDSSAPPAYSLADVATHNTDTNCWTAIEGNVYDVTDYIDEHPGREGILQSCGVDATGLFNGDNAWDKVHTALAKSLLNQYKIGTLK